MQGRLDDAAAAMGGEVIGAPADTRWRGAVLDSRQVGGAELFFALPGEQTDGHRFVADALARGAAAAVVARGVDAEGALIRVADGYRALHALTRAVRRRAPEHLVAVTGSVGKTTTKELLAAMLAERYRVGSTPGNLNNLYGFPLALLGIDDDTQWMVAEMGMSVPGELGQISRLGQPEVAVFTNVRAAHLESFGSLRSIARAKAELLEGLAPDGLVIANADDPEVMWIAARHAGRTVTYGVESTTADVRAVDLEARHPVGTRFRLLAEGVESPVEQWLELPLHGRYNVENCLAAAATALALSVSVEAIAEAILGLEPGPGRGVVHALAGGAVLIDDSYNSNPSALAQALEAAAVLPGQRHWAVLGDMLELGDRGPRYHQEAGAVAAAAGYDPIYGVGELSRELVAGAAAGGATTGWWATADEAAAELEPARSGDVVLVKGSRAIGLERVVAAALEGSGGGV
ncbi:MAG: UDP-N-acetylmuramoyl-tripeptide--D-alanyl-D-alanine ligase [Acidobacteria bacterium]|nr:UDP-N-acetylmuramoyl-tripeptide--D-alanyl-D-alanine ligase [Acidobacteriota bacterium]